MRDNRNHGTAEPELLLALEKLLQAFNLSPESTAIASLEEELYIDVNQTFLETLGYRKEEVIGQKIDIWASPAEREQSMALLLSNNGRVRGQEIVYVDREGKQYTGLWSADVIQIGGERCLLSNLLDITDRKQMEEALRKREQLFRLLAENARDIIYRVGLRPRRVEYVSPSIQDITGYTPEDHYNDPWLIFNMIHPEDRAELMKPATLYHEKPMIIRWIARDGKVIWTEQRHRVVRDEQQQVVALEGIARDITERVLLEDHLRHTSLHDALTSLYNRAYFEEEMRRLENSRQDMEVAIIGCDVDGLKLVNDIMGHAEGDRIIKAAAEVLENSFRYGDVVARVGGDEFAAIVAPATKALAIELCDRVVKGVELYNQKTSGVPLGLSVGYALRTERDMPLAEVYRDADSEMYRHKMHNRKQYRQNLLRAMALGAESVVYHSLPEDHIERMKMVVSILAREMKLSRKRTEMLMRLAEFHDIGMVGLPDALLAKSEELTQEDWELIKQHCDNGYRIANIVPELNPLAEGILSHHEHWDGSGYPKGLKGHKIPVESRVISIADAFSAMTCPRSYRAPITIEQAIMELENGVGAQFDPNLTDKFIAAYQRAL